MWRTRTQRDKRVFFDLGTGNAQKPAKGPGDFPPQVQVSASITSCLQNTEAARELALISEIKSAKINSGVPGEAREAGSIAASSSRSAIARGPRELGGLTLLLLQR